MPFDPDPDRHFTYDDLDPTTLHQGDVIRRTEGVESILQDIHPYFAESAPDYPFFMVLTQTCDLVRRNGSPKSRYISLAAVRRFDVILERAIERCQYNDLERVLAFADQRNISKLHDFVERLLNNNEPEYFYLHRQANAGLVEDHCAVLQVSITFRTEPHYDTLLAAKTLQLKEGFEHKLGYLVGNTFSRVATEDWVPDHVDAETFRKTISQIVKEHKDSVQWIPSTNHSDLMSELKGRSEEELASLTPHALGDIVKHVTRKQRQEITARKTAVLDAVAETLRGCEVADDTTRRVCNRLKSDPRFSTSIR